MVHPQSYHTIAHEAFSEITVKGSKFMAYAFRVQDLNEIQQRIQEIKLMHPKARHWCYAWKLRPDTGLYKAQDDGEPSGTAGRPILNQIESTGLHEVLVVVVRYFGGTLLGTSGLLKAYKEAAKQCLGKSPTLMVAMQKSFGIKADHARIQALIGILKSMNISTDQYSVSESQAEIHFKIPAAEEHALFKRIKARLEKTNLEQVEDPKSIANCLVFELDQ